MIWKKSGVELKYQRGRIDWIGALFRLHGRDGLEFGAEDAVPETARHTEAVLIVGEVVLEMVFFQFSPIRGEPSIEMSVLKLRTSRRGSRTYVLWCRK